MAEVATTRGLEFARESLSDVIAEITPLTELHWKEVAHFKDIPLKINWGAYRAMEENGALVLFTARKNGNLVGYSAFMVVEHPHYAGSIQANQDVIFILPEHRGFGRHFIAWCNERLKEIGVQIVYIHVNPKHDFGSMLGMLGFERTDIVYGRRLD